MVMLTFGLTCREDLCRWPTVLQLISDRNKTDGKTIMNHMNNTDKDLEIKLSEEVNNTINYLDLSIHRNTNSTDTETHTY